MLFSLIIVYATTIEFWAVCINITLFSLKKHVFAVKNMHLQECQTFGVHIKKYRSYMSA